MLFPKHRRELYVSGASNRRQWREVRQERNPSMAYPLGQPLDSLSRALSSFCISFLFARPIRPFSPLVSFPRPRPAYILSVDAHIVVSPPPSVSRWTLLSQGQPLVNLIISATPDKRRRQNVIPACSLASSPSSSRIPSGADS